MKIQGITPIVTTPNLPAVRDFYVRHFGFHVSFDHDHYLGLRAGADGSPEIGFMLPDDMAPDVFGGQGITFAIRVPDADAAHAAMLASGAPILQPPTDQPWGARSFVTRDPAGVVVYVSHPIPIAPELAAHVR